MKTWCSDRGNTVWDKVFDNQHQHQHHHKQHQKPPERPICRLGLGAQGTQVWCSFKLVWMTTELLVTSYPGLWITEKFGWRGNRWPCRPLSCHTIPRVLSTHWHSFTGAHMSLLLSGREGVRLVNVVEKKEVEPDEQGREKPDLLLLVVIDQQLLLSPPPPHHSWAAHWPNRVTAHQRLEKAHLQNILVMIFICIWVCIRETNRDLSFSNKQQQIHQEGFCLLTCCCRAPILPTWDIFYSKTEKLFETALFTKHYACIVSLVWHSF